MANETVSEREEIERRMEAARRIAQVKDEDGEWIWRSDWERHDDAWAAAVSVAIDLLREQRAKWGHVAGCSCNDAEDIARLLATAPGVAATKVINSVRDPRCAPIDKEPK